MAGRIIEMKRKKYWFWLVSPHTDKPPTSPIILTFPQVQLIWCEIWSWQYFTLICMTERLSLTQNARTLMLTETTNSRKTPEEARSGDG